MDTITRRPATRRRSSPVGRATVEIEVAIQLVTSGAARTVRLSGLPGAARLAASTAAKAQAADVGFMVERTSTSVVLRIGPKMRR